MSDEVIEPISGVSKQRTSGQELDLLRSRRHRTLTVSTTYPVAIPGHSSVDGVANRRRYCPKQRSNEAPGSAQCQQDLNGNV
jgi:hypothetical protein